MSPRRSRSTKNQQVTDEPLSAAVHHILEIKDWDWVFSFGANESGDIDGPYWDYRHLELRCTMLGPGDDESSSGESALATYARPG